MEKPTETRIFFFAAVIILAAYLVATSPTASHEYVLEQRAQVDLLYQQSPEGTRLFVNVKCEAMLKPMSEITGALFGVDLCDEE